MKKVLTIILAAATMTFAGVALEATPFAPNTPKAEAAYYNFCQGVQMDGREWCYQMGCTAFEERAYGCYTGWVLVNRWNA